MRQAAKRRAHPPEVLTPKASSPGTNRLTEDVFVDISARILMAAEGAPVGADGRITPEGLQEIERRTEAILAERGLTREQVNAYEEAIKDDADLERVKKRIHARFMELKKEADSR
jgi:hypothetical protein